ncbi:MAG: hypothetical protein KatS3mg105_3396 [Gemmatales bacterium]|nr:MAG: hypothetical protein KatS3mg105_3396 [Gemmatales bacterium]
MNPVSVGTRRDDVQFHFLGANEDSLLTGSVLVRPGEMVLDIPGGYGPYLIVGAAHGHRYEGVSSIRGKSNRVEARWADVGGMYVGVWHEDGEEYLFSFELPEATD